MNCMCLSGIKSCVTSFNSAPKWDLDQEEVDFENRVLGQLLSLISTLLTPVKARQDFLPDFSIDFKPAPDSERGSLSPQSDDMWTGETHF